MTSDTPREPWSAPPPPSYTDSPAWHGPGYQPPEEQRRRVSVWLIVAVVLAAVLGILVVGSIAFVFWFTGTYEREQVALVEDAMGQLAEGRPIDDSQVCGDPDELVQALTRDADAWPVGDFEVLGISADTPVTPLSLWYVDVRVDGELWVFETWDRDAGHMAGICAIGRR